jgi:beta-glucosidase
MHRAIRAGAENASIGFSTNPTYFESAGSKWDNWLTAKAKYYWNDWFLNRVSNDLDFIGMNYYFHSRINFIPNRNLNEKVSDMGWELYPRSLGKILVEFAHHGKPIYITESGLADMNDVNRGWFIRESLTAVKSVIKKGVDVRGYFHWSLLDNFEWDKGFWPKFGLIEIDRKTLKRIPRPSAEIYKSLITDSTNASGVSRNKSL